MRAPGTILSLMVVVVLVMGIGALGGGCQGEVQMEVLPPQDLDRQCTPDKGCREGLLCVPLLVTKRAVDGGIAEMVSYTCHPRCGGDAECPTGYRCYRPMPPPMEAVCVRSEVVDRLQNDGGM